MFRVLCAIALRVKRNQSGMVSVRLKAVVATRAKTFKHPTTNKSSQEHPMNIALSFGPVASLIAGILILIMPKMLNYIVALYLIVVGLVGLFGTGNFHLR